MAYTMQSIENSLLKGFIITMTAKVYEDLIDNNLFNDAEERLNASKLVSFYRALV